MTTIESVDKNLRILIADDYALTRGMIKSILRQLGFLNITAVENGDLALHEIREHGADLVICDWNMPQRTGLEVLRAIREDERFKDLPFLMLTAEVYRENVAEAMSAGVSDYIAKPFTAQILSDKIVAIYSRKKA